MTGSSLSSLLPIAMKHPEIKLDPFYICFFASNIRHESAYMLLSLAFDFCAFVTIVVSAYRSLPPSSGNKLRFTGVIGTVLRDATIYFAMIFTSHLTLTMFIFFARVCPIMISFGMCNRLSLSRFFFLVNRIA